MRYKRNHNKLPKTPLLTICALLASLLFTGISWSKENPQKALDALIDGLHRDAHEANYDNYFARYTPDAVFMGTDKSERWKIDEFKAYAAPAFADGHGWTYLVRERHWEGNGNIRWFDEILFNEKLGHCRGTGVVEKIDGEWRIAHYSLTLLIPNDIAEQVGAQSKTASQ